MQRSLTLLLSCALAVSSVHASSTPKVHTVGLGPVKRVPYLAQDVTREEKDEEAGTLRVRPLIVDTKLKEWTAGDMHEITERTFAVRRVLHVNDTLPGEKTSRWVWQPGPWLLVDRITGHVTALHLPDFDGGISEVVWYRDYAAYCGVHSTAKGGNLTANVWQIGSRHAALSRTIEKWPAPERVRPVCAPARWQREPMRVTLQMTGGDPLSFDVLGTSTALVEEGDSSDE